MVERQGISYIRTTRERTPILYVDKLDDFRVGGSPSYAAGAQTTGSR
jgi:transketolase C-terminal domain/subunit